MKTSLHKNCCKNGASGKCWRKLSRGVGVSQMLTIADEVGGWVHEPLILADVICEQPLISVYNLHLPKIGQNLISAGHWDKYITLQFGKRPHFLHFFPEPFPKLKFWYSGAQNQLIVNWPNWSKFDQMVVNLSKIYWVSQKSFEAFFAGNNVVREREFPFPVIPGNTILKFPFPYRSREKEVFAGN